MGLEPQDQRALSRAGVVGYTVAEVARMLRISETGTRNMIERGELPSVRVGRLWRIPSKAFHQKYGEAMRVE